MASERVSLNYENLSTKYIIKNRDYSKQYCKIYLVRLEKMSDIFEDVIQNKWKDKYKCCKLHKLSDENKGEKYIVIGTLFKDQKLKPSVLKRLSEANQLVPQPVYTHFTHESDTLYVEDELQRYQLTGKLQIIRLRLSCKYQFVCRINRNEFSYWYNVCFTSRGFR